MNEQAWKRLAGLCALTALAVHGIGALGYYHDPGIWSYSLWDHYQHALVLLLPELPAGELPIPAVSAELPETAEAPVVSTLPALHPSRGPPAA